jgi:phosphoglucomutase
LGKLKGKEYIVKTIVTTEMIASIARKFNVPYFDCYTGFKWIAAVMRENEGKMQYIGGGEESYGFLAEDFVRDKDAVSACVLIAEVAAWAKDNGKSLYDLIQEIYVKFGFSKEKGISVVKKGKSGAEEIKEMMTRFRSNPPKELAGSPVTVIKDYGTLRQIDLLAGQTTELEMPETANVLQYFTQDGTKVSVRPSGTEPKIKFYIEVKLPLASADEYEAVNAAAEEKVLAVKASLGL